MNRSGRKAGLADALLAGGPDTLRALRAEGPAGLSVVLAALEATSDPAARARLVDAATRVSGQKDAHVSGLYRQRVAFEPPGGADSGRQGDGGATDSEPDRA